MPGRLMQCPQVLFMVPGLAFLYSGLSRRKNALSLVWAVVFSNAVTIFTWCGSSILSAMTF